MYNSIIIFQFQSTLLQEERLSAMSRNLSAEIISIHAPTRGATRTVPGCFLIALISIHAPTRGATKQHNRLVELNFISIHAPTRGATKKCHNEAEGVSDFNPRSYKRSDYSPNRKYSNHTNFNPRSYKRSDSVASAG